MVKIYKNLDVGLNVRKCSVHIFGNLYIGQYFRQNLLLSQNFEIVKFSEIISILVIFFHNLEFGENYG